MPRAQSGPAITTEEGPCLIGAAALYETFESRFSDLRFLSDTSLIDQDALSVLMPTCGWSFGCVRGTPNWFRRYVWASDAASTRVKTRLQTPDAPVPMAVDALAWSMHVSEADVMRLMAKPITTAATAGASDRARPSFACFAEGTKIATERGQIAVQSLGVGDLVHTVLDGRLKPIVWTGRRTIECRRHSRPERVWPIRVAASAFGPNLPRRDVLLSPDHAVYWIDALIPVRCLINGVTIAQLPVAEMTYFHLELQHHDVVLADGLPAETYLDTGVESVFHGQDGPIALYPDLASRLWDAKSCAPLVVHGPLLDRLRQWLKIAATTCRPTARGATKLRASCAAKSA
jgi:hypothetical protein